VLVTDTLCSWRTASHRRGIALALGMRSRHRWQSLLTEQLEIAVPHRRNFAEGVNCVHLRGMRRGGGETIGDALFLAGDPHSTLGYYLGATPARQKAMRCRNRSAANFCRISGLSRRRWKARLPAPSEENGFPKCFKAFLPFYSAMLAARFRSASS
jgi:hypothetical protein